MKFRTDCVAWNCGNFSYRRVWRERWRTGEQSDSPFVAHDLRFVCQILRGYVQSWCVVNTRLTNSCDYSAVHYVKVNGLALVSKDV